MAQVRVEMHGNLRRFLPHGAAEARVPLQPGDTVLDVVRRLGAADEVWVAAVNGVVVALTTPLQAGDVLCCFESIHGG